MVQTTTGPGGGFTSRLLTVPDGDIAEDQMVTATGSYSATAPLSSGQWIMQMVAFRTPRNMLGYSAGSAHQSHGEPRPVSSQINLSWTASASCAGIADYVVQRCQGASCTNFAQVGDPTGTTFDDTRSRHQHQLQLPGAGRRQSSGTRVHSLSWPPRQPGDFGQSPRVTALTFTRTQQFTSASSGSVTWSVDGVVGGSASSGTITTAGLYTPPIAPALTP